MLRFLSLLLGTLLLTGLAQAANVNFNGGEVRDCNISNSTTYNCGTSFLGGEDIAVIASGYTVIVNGSFQMGWGQGVKMSGTARLETINGGNIILTAANPNNMSITGGTIKASGYYVIGGSVKNITANIIASSIGNTGEASTVNGSLTATGDISLATGTTVTGSVSGAAVTTASNIVIGGSLTATGAINLGSGTNISGAVSGASIKTSSNIVLGGALSVTGTIQLGSSTSVNGAVSGASITADADVVLRNSLTVKGDISLGSRTAVTGAVSGGSITAQSDVKLGSTLSTTGAIYLLSRTSVAGAITGSSIKTESGATLNGPVKVGGAAYFESETRVNGNLEAASLNLRPSNTTITGNVNVTGDITMGSSTVINGDVVGNNVKTESSSARINGNALVYSLYLAWDARVSKVVTCKVPGDFPCSCVTYESGYTYRPTCAAAPAAGAHHFQITHTGSALTCQPQTVKVTACANAACTAPHFTGSSSSVTLQPGGKSFTFTGETTAAAPATVEQTTVGTARIVATGTSGTVCVNTANASATDQCLIDFEDTGLLVNVDDHIAATSANVSIQALTATSTKQSCVPLVKDKTENINLSCGFIKPGSDYARAGAKISFNGSDLSCGAGTVRLSLAFDGNGVAKTKLTYPEVGQLSLTATYAGSTAYTAKGTDTFIVAPARFNIEATSASGKKVAAGAVVGIGSAVFAKAGEEFTVKISAVNDKGEVTTNFGKETNQEATQENIKLTALAVDNPDDAGNAGDITAGVMNAITNGVSSSKTDSTGPWRFSDVGIIRLELGLKSGVGYLGAAGDQFKTAGTQKIGRFIPDHFDTSLPIFATLTGSRTREMVAPGQLAGMTMPCKATSNSTPLLAPCDPVFIYSHQPFYVIVKAYNSANGLTINYQGSLAKPITLSAAATLGGATLVDSNVGAMGGSIAGTAPLFAFFKGLGRVEDPNFNLPAEISMPMFRFKALPSAATGSNPVRFFVRAVDTDGATSQRATASASMETAITAVSGRLVVPNIDGSPTSPMPVTVQAQFYDANRGFTFNPMYNAPAKSLAGYLRFDRCEKGLATVCATAAQLQPVAPGTAAFQSGKAGFRLTPPSGQNGLGSVDFTMQKPCTPTPACNADAQWIYYLPSTTGKLTFGVYRSGPVIYTREIY